MIDASKPALLASPFRLFVREAASDSGKASRDPRRLARGSRALLIAGVMTVLPSHGGALAGAPAAEVMRLGPSRVMCFKAPCPKSGTMAVSRGAAGSPHPIYQGPPPRLRAAPTIRLEVERAWEAKRCLIVQARVLPDRRQGFALAVDRVLRPC